MQLRESTVSVCALVLAACGAAPEDYDFVDRTEQGVVDNQQVLGFESSALWTASAKPSRSTASAPPAGSL